MIQKLSVSLPISLCEFIEKYQKDHGLSSRSEVLVRAIHLLQEHVLEANYHEANQEWNTALDNLAGDQ